MKCWKTWSENVTGDGTHEQDHRELLVAACFTATVRHWSITTTQPATLPRAGCGSKALFGVGPSRWRVANSEQRRAP